MATGRTLGIAVTAAVLGAAVGYVAGLREFAQHPEASETGRGDDAATGSARERVIRVSPRQVQAARVAIEARKLLGEPVPPGLRRIANARRQSTSAEPRSSGDSAARQVIQVSPRQVRAARISFKAHRRLGMQVPPGLQRIANAGKSRPDREYESYAYPEGRVSREPSRRRSPRSPSERAAHATEEAWRRLERQYGLYRASEIGQRLGCSPHRAQVDTQRSAGRLLGVRRGSSLRYPGYQVGPDGKLAPVIGDLIALAREYGWTDESLALWLAKPSGSMPDDRAPAELLHDDPQLVLEAARRVMQPTWQARCSVRGCIISGRVLG